MTDNMIERVALAIYDDLKLYRQGYDVPDMHDAARAAIEAMREPTEVMTTDAGFQLSLAYPDAHGSNDKEAARTVWRSMIDAALTSPHAQ